MKKIIKPLVIIICTFILDYGVFVGVDCVRLYNVGESNEPIITINETRKEDYCKYEGLGYTVTYMINSEKEVVSEGNGELNNYPGSHIYGAEFRLFDKILLWAWIE